MSRSFLGFGQSSYIGVPSSLPIKLAGISGTVIPLLFQWLSYGASTAKPNINVLVDMTPTACKAVDQIRSVYIDNLGSDNPVYIYFPDTGYTLAAKPNSEGWYPALTNDKKIWVIGEGFLTGDIPQTFLLVSNIPMAASVNDEIDNAVALWRASPTITRGTSIYNSAFGIPALGDQLFASTALNLGAAGAAVPLFGSPYASGFIFLTMLVITIPYMTASVGTIFPSISLESTGVGGVLIAPQFVASASFGAGIPPGLSAQITLPGLQTKLDATQSWRVRTVVPCTAGEAQVYASFTQQP